MNSTLKHASIAVAAVAAMLGISTPASAQFRATICNDIQCTGGDDFVVTDNDANDLISMPGVISFSRSAFGYAIAVNTSQSKPVVGSAAPLATLVVPTVAVHVFSAVSAQL